MPTASFVILQPVGHEPEAEVHGVPLDFLPPMGSTFSLHVGGVVHRGTVAAVHTSVHLPPAAADVPGHDPLPAPGVQSTAVYLRLFR